MSSFTTTSSRAVTPLLILGIVVVGSNSFVLSPILTDVAQDFGTTAVVVARVISAYGISTAISALFLAGAIDRYGARRMLCMTATVLTTALLVSAASQSWQVLATAQAFAGVSAGIMLPAIYATATSSASGRQGARALGRVLNGWSISLVAGVPVSAFITEYGGWRWAYVTLAAVAFTALLGFLGCRLPANSSNAQQISPLAALRTPGIPALLLICFGYMSAFYGVYAFLGDHLRLVLGLDAALAGTVVLAYGAGFGLASLGTFLLDRIGPARLFPFSLAAIAMIYLLLIPASQSYEGALCAALVWGIVNHYGLNILVLLLSERHPDARGTILGLHSAVTYTAVFAGPLFMGHLYAVYGFSGISLAASGLALGAMFVSCLAVQSRPRSAEPNAREHR